MRASTKRRRKDLELKQIYAPIQKDLDKVKDTLKSISRIDYEWLSKQLNYIVSETGKGMRPALTLLAGKLYHYNLTYLLPMSASVELMHTATLVHDDAIDKAPTRRGQVTINSKWGDEIAILMGDFLFAKAGEFVSGTQTPRGIKLFSLATQSGAILGKAPEESVVIMKEYADNLGIAFQVVDDILDFTSTVEALGKPVGSDLIQGTLTLPAIFIIERNPKDNPVGRFLLNRECKKIANNQDTITKQNSKLKGQKSKDGLKAESEIATSLFGRTRNDSGR